MQCRFSVPSRFTRVRFFSSSSSLAKAFLAERFLFLLDEGVASSTRLDHAAVLRIRGGEKSKRWSEVERVLGWLAKQQAERSQPLVVIGGGAVLDLGALAASLYRRGMPVILVPTSLLAMVDATLGGKTAVDLEMGGRLLKNFAGTFYPAAEVWVCTDFLHTLPLRERLSGAGEVFKTLWINGAPWSSRLLVQFAQEGKTGRTLQKLVQRCLTVKARLVERDPLDKKRIREVLNFGHTVGHALESASGLSHGECVLWGMAVETLLLEKAGQAMFRECIRAIAALGLVLPKEFSTLSTKKWISLLQADKKNKAGKIEMSLLERPGRIVKKRFSAERIAQAIKAFPESFRPA